MKSIVWTRSPCVIGRKAAVLGKIVIIVIRYVCLLIARGQKNIHPQHVVSRKLFSNSCVL